MNVSILVVSLVAAATAVVVLLVLWQLLTARAAAQSTATEERARSSELVVQLAQAQGDLAQARAEAAAARATVTALQERGAQLLAQLEDERKRNDELAAAAAAAQAESAQARTQLASEREAFGRERAGIEQKMLGQFQSLAQQALGDASTAFLNLAVTKLGKEHETLNGNLATRVAEMKGIVSPIFEEFSKFGQAVSALQKDSSENLGKIKTELESVARLQTSLQDAVRTTNDATGQLRNALQNPRIAGNWGEISLDRIVEIAGMTEHIDDDRQTGTRASGGTLEKPDLTIHLTGGLNIPLDAKASTANYIRAVGAADEAERRRLLEASARDIKARVTELRGRAYDGIPGYAGMTIMFVPNESMLSSALALEPDLIEDALRSNIVICSPLLLLCYLRAFANGWRLQKQQENAEEVARRGRMLHDRLQSFFAALGKVGWYLNHTVEKFNIVVGKMDNLLVPGREMSKMLGLTGELLPVAGVDTLARAVGFKQTEDDIAPALRDEANPALSGSGV